GGAGCLGGGGAGRRQGVLESPRFPVCAHHGGGPAPRREAPAGAGAPAGRPGGSVASGRAPGDGRWLSATLGTRPGALRLPAATEAGTHERPTAIPRLAPQRIVAPGWPPSDSPAPSAPPPARPRPGPPPPPPPHRA